MASHLHLINPVWDYRPETATNVTQDPSSSASRSKLSLAWHVDRQGRLSACWIKD